MVASDETASYNRWMMTEPVEVIHDAPAQRFCAKLQGYEACLMYRPLGKELDLYHTYVPEVFRGRGIAEKLCKAAFEYAKAQGLSVLPSCTYVSDAYLKRHPEYEALTRRGGPSSYLIVSG